MGSTATIVPSSISIGVPTHDGSLSIPTVNSLLKAGSKTGHQVGFQLQAQSLLARNFNGLFKGAYERGERYFCLLHADIGVDVESSIFGSWIDVLIMRMQQLKAAALSVISPIKTVSGHTSSGLFIDRNNNFDSLRRLTMRQAVRLPKYAIERKHLCDVMEFDPNKVGAMLVNTGCLIIDLRAFPWHEWPGFEIKDKIAWSPNKQIQLHTVPEDWGLSAFLYEKGWPYYLSRELVLNHIGTQTFDNQQAWGDEVDECPVIWTAEEWEQGLAEHAEQGQKI